MRLPAVTRTPSMSRAGSFETYKSACGVLGPRAERATPNRQYVFDPWLNLITSFMWIVSDPLNGTCPAENRRQQITHDQVFNLSVAGCGPDRRTLQKAGAIIILAWAAVLAWAA